MNYVAGHNVLTDPKNSAPQHAQALVDKEFAILFHGYGFPSAIKCALQIVVCHSLPP